MRQGLFKLMEEAMVKIETEHEEIYKKWAEEDDSASHLEIKKLAVREIMKITGGKINPSLIGSMVGEEFPHCH